MFEQLFPGYRLRQGSGRERATLVQFIEWSYQELFPEQTDFSHLATTVRQYFSQDTPVWWIELTDAAGAGGDSRPPHPVACLWVGNAIDQVQGVRHAHIFLLYVLPDYRRQGIGSALMHHAEAWARARGDRQIGLQVFQANQPALDLYQRRGYQAQSLWMVKPLDVDGRGS